MKQNNMLAMILAGGRGSRLHELTNKVAKPAVSYGGCLLYTSHNALWNNNSNNAITRKNIDEIWHKM